MFSRKERDLLAILAEGHRQGRDPQSALVTAFPSASYRRKLLWGIRRKASGAARDLELYLEAARKEGRVVSPARTSGPYPVAADPLVSLLRAVQGFRAPGPTKALRKARKISHPARPGGRP